MVDPRDILNNFCCSSRIDQWEVGTERSTANQSWTINNSRSGLIVHHSELWCHGETSEASETSCDIHHVHYELICQPIRGQDSGVLTNERLGELC